MESFDFSLPFHSPYDFHSETSSFPHKRTSIGNEMLNNQVHFEFISILPSCCIGFNESEFEWEIVLVVERKMAQNLQIIKQ